MENIKRDLDSFIKNLKVKGTISQNDIITIESFTKENIITKDHKLTLFTKHESTINFDKAVKCLEDYRDVFVNKVEKSTSGAVDTLELFFKEISYKLKQRFENIYGCDLKDLYRLNYTESISLIPGCEESDYSDPEYSSDFPIYLDMPYVKYFQDINRVLKREDTNGYLKLKENFKNLILSKSSDVTDSDIESLFKRYYSNLVEVIDTVKDLGHVPTSSSEDDPVGRIIISYFNKDRYTLRDLIETITSENFDLDSVTRSSLESFVGLHSLDEAFLKDVQNLKDISSGLGYENLILESPIMFYISMVLVLLKKSNRVKPLKPLILLK